MLSDNLSQSLSRKEQRAQQRKNWASLDLCTACGRPREDNVYKTCFRCRGARRKDSSKRYEERRATGVCVVCLAPSETARCLQCSGLPTWKHRPSNSPQYQRDRHHKRRALVISHYGSQCACCGESQDVFLALDHIDGGGNKHRKELKSKSLWDWIIKNNFPDGFQVLCHNCNAGKYRNGGVCPHKGLE